MSAPTVVPVTLTLFPFRTNLPPFLISISSSCNVEIIAYLLVRSDVGVTPPVAVASSPSLASVSSLVAVPPLVYVFHRTKSSAKSLPSVGTIVKPRL